MIKSIYQITLRDIILLDATKTANSLKKYWFVPLFPFRKRLEKLATEIFKLIGNSPVVELQDEFDKIMAYRRLQILEALYKAVIIEVGLKSRIEAWKILIGKDLTESEQFEEVKKEVLKHTRIELKSPEDIDTLRQYIEHKVAKYKEMYPEIKQDEDKPKANLTKVIYSVFNYMSEPYNENMRLITFVELKNMAEEKIKQQTKTEDNEQ